MPTSYDSISASNRSRAKVATVPSGALTLEQRCRLAFLQVIGDQEERSGRPLTAEDLRRALTRYPQPSLLDRNASRQQLSEERL